MVKQAIVSALLTAAAVLLVLVWKAPERVPASPPPIEHIDSFMPKGELSLPPLPTRRHPALERRIPGADWTKIAFRDAIDDLSRKISSTIVVNWPAVEGSGVWRSTEIDLRLRDIEAEAALSELLKAATGGKNALGYVVEDGVIHIVPKFQADYRCVRVYNVRDLVIRAMRFRRSVAPLEVLAATRPSERAPKATQDPFSAARPHPREATEEAIANDLIDLAGAAYVPAFRPTHDILYWSGYLIVNQTVSVHEKIENLLATLRKIE